MAYFHEGEVALQAESGVDSAAFEAMARQSMVPGLHPREAEFVEQRTFAAATTIDRDGRPWSSPLFGSSESPLFAVQDPITISVGSQQAPGDPMITNIEDTSELGVLFFDPSYRRRIKSIGHATVVDDAVTYVLDRSFGICNKYIYKRDHVAAEMVSTASEPLTVTPDLKLDDESIAQLATADTAFLASYHEVNGADPTHRGGPAGFVTVVDDRTLSMPDYMGNGMFNTLGNLRIDNRIGFMTVDFASGRTIHVTGRGAVRPSPANDAMSERTLTIEVDAVLVTNANQGAWVDVEEFPIRPGMINPATPYLRRPPQPDHS